ncbi:hypothetical protein Desaci_4128 [Desulfosporosinus acidiphilus SJ4]|uniref:Uncharacterized protein n=1 Tax=Desulfosporosinus acidiphilus (strain DSM 22704 / JCM 16185 / SJ4) TaxID=646529 RepID=I4DB16_DESAJ|nr:hypothetical protein [Desulfosporosinus acidiphilus]AFM42990.1 hypothetical protein Desaci_4128 [Desulfosporosinus acidiphilus SJ4]
MKEQEKNVAYSEAAEKAEFKCKHCGNERIQSRDNYCCICGNLVKDNPVIIDYFSQKQ